MIDYEVFIYDRIARAVLEQFPSAYVSNESEITPPMFPAVSIKQTVTSEMSYGRDSSMEENYDVLTWVAQVYSNSVENGKEEAKAIMSIVDAGFRELGFRATSTQALENAADPSIYRMFGRYSAIASKNGTFHWRF